MLTLVLVFFVLIVPLVLIAQSLLFKKTEENYGREWALYEQRHD